MKSNGGSKTATKATQRYETIQSEDLVKNGVTTKRPITI